MSRYDELNNRLQDRNNMFNNREYAHISFDPRPVETKYTIFLTNNHNHNQNQSLIGNYNIQPIINTENNLRNTECALQTSNQRYFVPNSSSELYRVRTLDGTNHEPLAHNSLFSKPILHTSNRLEHENLGVLRFNNSTRIQMQNLE